MEKHILLLLRVIPFMAWNALVQTLSYNSHCKTHNIASSERKSFVRQTQLTLQTDICHILQQTFWHMYLAYLLKTFLAVHLVYLLRFFMVEVQLGDSAPELAVGVRRGAEEGGGRQADIKSSLT